MTKQLYEEALADVKKLKEVAEDNAKKALIEAVAPRIKDLIEAELLREAEDNPVDDGLLLDDEMGMSEPSIGAGVQSMMGGQPDVTAAISMPDADGKVTLDLDALVVEPGMTDSEYVLRSENAKKQIAKKLDEAGAVRFESKLFRLQEKARPVMNAGKLTKNLPGYKKLVNEMVSDVEALYKHLQESFSDDVNKVRYENILENIYKELNQLTEQTMKNKKSLTEAELSLKLTGIPDELADALDDIGVEIVADEAEADEGGEDEGEELDLGGEEEADEEGGDEEADEESELDLGGDEGGEDEEKKEEGVKMESRRLRDDMIVEIDENMLKREISRMKSLREAADDVQKWGHGAGDVSDDMDFEDENLGDPLDMDVTTEGVDEMDEMDQVDEMDELDQMDQMDELDQMYQMDQVDEMDEMDQMDELDQMDQATDGKDAAGPGAASNAQKEQQRSPQKESLLRRLASEKKLQLEAKKKAQSAKQKQVEAQKQAKKQQKEAQMKESEAKQKAQKKQMKEAQKAKADAQKKQKEAAQKAKQAKQMKEAYDFYATRYNESVRRTTRLQTMLAEVSKREGTSLNGSQTRLAEGSDNLRKKLAETNLFNMKLLYTNKLLQNESLTKRQKADVIERLDEASTEREVKLVYESLVKALSNKTNNLSEGRVLGSSSAPTRSASTVLNENYEADRWAKLAGIK